MNLNKVFIIGNLTRDPELRSLPSGQPVATFGMATNRVWKNQNGERQQQTEFHNIVAFGRLAEIASQYLNKGKMALIEGRIQTRSWEAQDGSKRSRTEIVVERLQLGPRMGGTRSGSAATPENKPADAASSTEAETNQSKRQTDGSETNQKKEQTKEEELKTVEYPNEEINPDDIPF